MIYLDYHASTPVDPRVMAAMASHFTENFGNPHATDHAAGWRAHETVETSARSIALTLGIDSDEIIFTSGATESNNLAILGIARRAPPSRRRILVSAIEHKSVLAAARAAATLGLAVEQIPVNHNGCVELGYLQQELRPDVLLVSVMAVNNEIGSLQAIGDIARCAHAVGAYMHTDAVQALAVGTLDLSSCDVDLLSISGHKIYGPKGIGLLFIRRDVQSRVEPLMYGGGQQNNVRPGTLPVPLCAGLAKAMELMNGDACADEQRRLRALRDDLVGKLQKIDERIRLNGPPLTARHPGNANLRFSGFDGRDLLASLQPRVGASAGAACTSGFPERSHVLGAIGLSDIEVDSSIRFSVGRFTTSAEIDSAVALVVDAIERLETAQAKALHTPR
jgi:cysteine desulfurase